MFIHKKNHETAQKILVGLLLLLFASNALAADKLKNAKIIGVLTLPTEYTKYIKSVVVAWSRKGEIFFLNKELKKNHSLKLDRLRIKNVVLGDKKLLISGSASTRNGKSVQKVLLVDLLASKVVDEWSTSEYKIYSIAFKDNQPVMINYKGDLIALKDSGKFDIIKNLPKYSFYISVANDTAVICTSKNIMDKKSNPSSCSRNGQYQWMKMGQWLGTMPPFMCGGFLIEPSQGRTKEMKNQIVVRDIKDGSIKKQKNLPKLISAKCAGDKLVYAAKHIYIASLPELDTLSEESCGNQRVKDLALVGDALICINRSLKIRKKQISPENAPGAKKVQKK